MDAGFERALSQLSPEERQRVVSSYREYGRRFQQEAVRIGLTPDEFFTALGQVETSLKSMQTIEVKKRPTVMS